MKQISLGKKFFGGIIFVTLMLSTCLGNKTYAVKSSNSMQITASDNKMRILNQLPGKWEIFLHLLDNLKKSVNHVCYEPIWDNSYSDVREAVGKAIFDSVMYTASRNANIIIKSNNERYLHNYSAADYLNVQMNSFFSDSWKIGGASYEKVKNMDIQYFQNLIHVLDENISILCKAVI